MALQMDPERRRKLLAMDAARRAWADRHGITNPDWAEDASPDRTRPGTPTPEQEMELERELRIISGQDPDTGRYLT